jgi:PAS domain-containing protein
MPKTDGSAADSGWSSEIGALPSEEILEALPESIVVTTTDTEIVYANGLARELMGRSLEEIRGNRIDAFLAPIGRDIAGPRWQASCRRPDGKTLDIEVFTGRSYGPTEHLVTLILHDMDARVDASTFGAESKLRAVIEQISAVTYTWSWRGDDYEVLYCSPQIETILGFTPDEWMASPTDWYEWVHPRTETRSSGRTSDASDRENRSPCNTGCSARTTN